LGVALLCARDAPADLAVSVGAISSIVRAPRLKATEPLPHAAQGLADLLAWAVHHRPMDGASRYEILPTADDGLDMISIDFEVPTR
jgi:hypothetical protein